MTSWNFCDRLGNLLEVTKTVATIVEQDIMAKGRGRPKTDRDDVTVKLDRTIATRAKMVAASRSVTLAEYLSELTRSAVDRDFAKEMKRVQAGGTE
jgi:hypothetical protein